MKLDEVTISRAILSEQNRVMLEFLEMDCTIVGGGPSGLACAAILAENDLKVGIIERKLSVGGGMWGGGMMFPRIVVQEEARRLLDRFSIRYSKYSENYYIASSVESVAKLTAAACDAGAEIFNLMSAEDVVIRDDGKVSGLVINWTTVETTGLHVDPLTIASRYIVDATGHDASIAWMLQKKGIDIKIHGEGFMWAERAESMITEHTKEIYPGLIMTGMAANAVAGESRMGPIFGGMLLSGERAADVVLKGLK